jgi:hypothetical protein
MQSLCHPTSYLGQQVNRTQPSYNVVDFATALSRLASLFPYAPPDPFVLNPEASLGLEWNHEQ